MVKLRVLLLQPSKCRQRVVPLHVFLESIVNLLDLILETMFKLSFLLAAFVEDVVQN